MSQALSFTEEKNGYSKTQVNTYLERIFGEYERMQREYRTLQEKSNELTQLCNRVAHEKNAASGLVSNYRIKISHLEGEIEKLKTRTVDQHAGFSTEVARVLMDAEVLAKQILDRAKEEEARLNDEARAENERLLALREQLKQELKTLWERLRYDKHD